MEKCPKCACAVLMDHLQVVLPGERSGDVRIRAYGDPGAVLFTEAVTSPMEATVCGGCGYVELFAVDPKVLVDAVAAAERRRKARP